MGTKNRKREKERITRGFRVDIGKGNRNIGHGIQADDT